MLRCIAEESGKCGRAKMAERHADASDCNVGGAAEEEQWSCTQTPQLHFSFQKEGRSVTDKDEKKVLVFCLVTGNRNCHEVSLLSSL